jgi:hypothetical protein
MPDEMMSNKISNVLGVALPVELRDQIDLRSKKNSLDQRDNENIIYLTNKSCWVRLVSSIKINDSDELKYFQTYFPTLDLKDPDSLAKKFVLFAGTSYYDESNQKHEYKLRSGIGSNNSAYSPLGNVEIQNRGYRPMPGITDVKIETLGKLGSIRSATINFKVWDKEQLDVIDALYFKMGYTMFLEWGQSVYYKIDYDKNNSERLVTLDLDQIDPFKIDNKEALLRKISKKIADSQGNYDAMLGMCTTFNFSFNQEGGYDCSIKLISLGSLAESIKINQSQTLPPLLKSEIEQLVKTAEELIRQKAREEKLKKDKENQQNNPNQPTTYPGQTLVDFLIQNKVFKNTIEIEGAKVPEILHKNIQGKTDGIIIGKDPGKGTDVAWMTRFGGVNIYPGDWDSSLVGTVQTMTLDRNLFAKSLKYFTKYTDKSRSDYVQMSQYETVYSPVYLNKTFAINSGFKRKGYDWVAPYYDEPVAGVKREFVIYLRYKNNLDIKSDYKDEEGIVMLKHFIDSFLDPMAPDSQYDFSGAKIGFVIDTSKTNMLKARKGNGTLEDISSAYAKSNQGNCSIFYLKGTINNGIVLSEDKKSITNTAGITSTSTKREAVAEPIDFMIELYDSSYISKVIPITDLPFSDYKQYQKKLQDEAAAASAGQTPPDPPPPPLDLSAIQAEEAVKYNSGLEFFLRTIQLHSINKTGLAENLDSVIVVKLADEINFTKQLFQNGIFSDIIGDLIDKDSDKKKADLSNIDETKLKTNKEICNVYASYGFNSNLMAKPSGPNNGLEIPQVEFKELLKAYVVPYTVNQSIVKDVDINHPVYINLGFLLMILNHMCIMYDSKEGLSVDKNQQVPIIYIDFNPETNFCLSDPLHMSTDVFKFLIQFRGTDSEYATLFDPKVIVGNKIAPASGSADGTPLFTPQTQDFLSGQLPEFKGIDPKNGDAYRGKIMNILVNIDYILSLCKNFTTNDENHTVKLNDFLQQLITDLNKFTGNINLFRLGYNDYSNCLYIVDDQITPMAAGEVRAHKATTSDIPLFGKYSIAKSLDIRTEVSSKLGNMLAISANSDIKSNNSTDATPFGHYNKNYIDRFKIQMLSIGASSASGSKDTTKGKVERSDSDIAAANMFNTFVQNNLQTTAPNVENISQATNYYIDRMNSRKGENEGTKASAMIPLSVNFSTDGISGFAIGHAFTLPSDLIPRTYYKSFEDGSSKGRIGFVITGLSNTIQTNTWTTEVKANMMYLKDEDQFIPGESSYNIQQLSSGSFIVINPQDSSTNNGSNTNFTANNTEAKTAVEAYLGRSISDTEFTELVAGTYAEASNNQKERAYVMATLLNRARNKSKTVSEVLREKNQFQSVTGTAADGHKPSKNFIDGPGSNDAQSIYGAATNILSTVPKNIVNFTSNDLKAYGPGTNPGYIQELKNRGGFVIGDTIFST